MEGLETRIFKVSHSLHSVKTFRISLNVIRCYLKTQNLHLNDILQQDPYKFIEAFDNWMDEMNYRSNPRRQHVNNTVRIFKHHGIEVDKDKLRDIVPAPKMQIYADEPLSLEVARTILLETRQPDLRLLLCLEKDTLARPEELVSLKLGNFNLTNDPPYLKIPEYAAKNNLEREAFFTQETKELFVAYLKKKGIKKQEQYIFLNNNEKHLDPIGDEKAFQKTVNHRYIKIGNKWRQNRINSPTLQQIIKPLERRGRKPAYTIHIYSFKKFGFTKIADTISELAAHAIAGHQEYLITYYKKSREERAEDYRKVAPKLQLFTAPTDLEKQQQAVEAEIKSLPPEALAKVLEFVKTAKEANSSRRL